VPTELGDLISDKDSAKAERVMKALVGMIKFDLKKLKRAFKEK
jgi:hypothetical protein